jgi:cholesterol transport system auxiliary component
MQMKKLFPILLAILLAGCAAMHSESPTLFDFGPLRVQPGTPLPALEPVSIAEIAVPSWLDRPLMFYRMNYANDQQPHSYAHSRWTMPPAQLIAQRLKSRIAQAGGVALSAADGAIGVPVLHIDVDDFTQTFDAPGHSAGTVALRASTFNGQMLIAQKTFTRQAPAPTPDAEGGARALAQATDAAIADVMQWLATLQQKN